MRRISEWGSSHWKLFFRFICVAVIHSLTKSLLILDRIRLTDNLITCLFQVCRFIIYLQQQYTFLSVLCLLFLCHIWKDSITRFRRTSVLSGKSVSSGDALSSSGSAGFSGEVTLSYCLYKAVCLMKVSDHLVQHNILLINRFDDMRNWLGIKIL